jgi:hypothetical protein
MDHSIRVLWAAAKEMYELYQECLRNDRPDLAKKFHAELTRLLDRIDSGIPNS